MRRRCFLPLVVCGLNTAAGLAQAQPTPVATPESQPSPEAMEAARRLFREGVESAQGGRWEDARERFSRTLQIRAAPIIRFNLALACENVGRLVEAIDLYRVFLQETPPGSDPARTAAATQQVAVIEGRVARLRVEVTGDEVREFRLDGRAQNLALLGVDIPVDPGPHTADLVGVAGDRQRGEGAVFEAETMRFSIGLSRTPAIQAAGAHDWSARTHSFGHWVARPGPGGRWIDWASRATVAAPSIWQRRPLTLALQLGYGAPAGLVAVSARYFPQAWFGVEASVGTLGQYGPSAALSAHARVTGSVFAFGLMAGMSAGLTSVTLSCASRGNACVMAPQSASVLSLSFLVGLTGEVRLGPRLALRATVGVRLLTNPADLRAMGDRSQYPGCASGGAALGSAPCDVYASPDASTVGGVAAIDLGYGF